MSSIWWRVVSRAIRVQRTLRRYNCPFRKFPALVAIMHRSRDFHSSMRCISFIRMRVICYDLFLLIFERWVDLRKDATVVLRSFQVPPPANLSY